MGKSYTWISKYEFNNKLLDDVTLHKVISNVTLTIVTPFNNLLLDVHFDKYIVGLHYIHILSMLENLQGV